MQQPIVKKPVPISLTKMAHRVNDKHIENPPKEMLEKQFASPTKQIYTSSHEFDSALKKKSPAFITQTQKKVSQVEAVHNQLNAYIDILDDKVTKLIEKHEAEFLVAYRNHIKKVREEMEEIRHKAVSNANSSMSQTEKIEALEKQLIIFREESLKLFEKVNQKQRIIYSLQNKLSEIQQQKNHLEKSVRNLTKRAKQLEGYRHESINDEKFITNSNSKDKQFQINRPKNESQNKVEGNNKLKIDLDGLGIFSTTRPNTSVINSKGASNRSRNHSTNLNQVGKNTDLGGQIQQINKKIDQIIGTQVNSATIQNLKQSIAEIFKCSQPHQIKTSREYQLPKTLDNKTTELRKSLVAKVNRSFYQSKISAKRSQMQEIFEKCVQSVRKQIIRRKGLKNLNFYNEYAKLSITQFKKVDFFRLLQLILSNDKILAAVHKIIFEEMKIVH